MHTVHAAPTGPDAATGAVARPTVKNVAIAGATGYTGQELLRLRARHPAVTIATATSSGATAAVRTLPALAHIWAGVITPLVPETLADADVGVLALPDSAEAASAPPRVDA